MPTIQNIRAYINGLSSLPVNKNTQVYYGNTDATTRPLVLFSDLDQSYQRDTCGIQVIESTFNIHVITDGSSGTLAQAENISEQVDALIEGQQITPQTSECFCERYQVITEQTYIYHVVRSYRLFETTA